MTHESSEARSWKGQPPPGSLLPSLLSLEGPAAISQGYSSSLWRGTIVSCQQPAPVSNLGSRASDPAEPSEDCGPSQYPTATWGETVNQNHPDKPLPEYWSTDTVKDNVHCGYNAKFGGNLFCGNLREFGCFKRGSGISSNLRSWTFLEFKKLISGLIMLIIKMLWLRISRIQP